MDSITLEKLEFDQVRRIISRYARTSLGRNVILRIAPANNPDLVRLWLAETRQMLAALGQAGMVPLAGASDITDLIGPRKDGRYLEGDDFARIGQTLNVTGEVSDYLHNLGGSYNLLQVVAERVGDFRTLSRQIFQVVDSRGDVRDDASQKLLRIRRTIESMHEQVKSVFTRILNDSQATRWLQYSNFTFHNDRMVLPLRSEQRGRIRGIIHRSSDSGATLFVEPEQAVELNNRITQFRKDEKEEINRLFWELDHTLGLNREGIVRSIHALARVDMLVAKAQYAIAIDGICPELDDQVVLKLFDARHPLLIEMRRQELQDEQLANTHRYTTTGADLADTEQADGRDRPAAAHHDVVPIDIRLGEDFDLLIITGPNTGGKTCALKTVGLIALMVQSGLFVPVRAGSSMPVYKRIMIDVGDEQSLQQSLSTFSGHMQRILWMLKQADSRSLVLIDELGAGTDPDEGSAIGQTILEEFMQRNSRVIASTHLGQLKAFPFTHDRADNAAVEFDVETLRPTYRVTIGEPGNSNAIVIAQALGMPEHMVGRARKNLGRQARNLQKAIDGTVAIRRKAEHARRQAEDHAQQVAEQQRKLSQQQAELEHRQARFDRWAERMKQLKSGDRVHVAKFNRPGTVVRMQLHQQMAVVDMGAFQVEVPLVELSEPAEAS